MRRAGAQDGFALIAALMVMMIVLGLGAALLTFSDVQQRAATRQSSNEQAFILAEAALNAQIFEISSQWPTAAANAHSAYPAACTAASAGASFCPNPTNSNGSGSFGSGYNPGGTAACPPGTPTDPWSGSSTVYNGWTTYVRDDGPTGSSSTSALYNSSVDQTQPAYDANGNGIVWARAVGVVNCRAVTVVARVSDQLLQLNFPQSVIDANGFETSNNGNKTIIDRQGSSPQPSLISVRCRGLTGPGQGTPCTNYGKSAQVSPAADGIPSGWLSPPSPSTTLSATQLAAVKAQAIANGTYFTAPNCPTSITQLTGAPVYIENCGALSFTGNGAANSAASPGYVVLYNGTLDLGGTTNFYGEIYAANAQGSTGDVVTLHGNTTVQGAITVDGQGTINFGSSGVNIVFDPTIFSQMTVSGGAAGTPNSFRVLPQGQ